MVSSVYILIIHWISRILSSEIEAKVVPFSKNGVIAAVWSAEEIPCIEMTVFCSIIAIRFTSIETL